MSQNPQAAPRLHAAIAGGLWYSLAPVLLSAMSVPVIAYIIRQLGPRAYGEWTTATALIGVVMILANLGLRGAFVREVARDPTSGAVATANQLGLRLCLSLAAGGVALGACLLLGYSTIVLQCTAIAVGGLVLLTISTTLSDLLQAVHRLHIVATVGFISGAVLTATSALAIWQGAGPVMLSVAYLVGPLTGAVLAAAIVHRRLFPVRVSLNPARSWALLSGSKHFTIQQIVGAFSANTSVLLLPALAGSVSFGFFAAGSLLTTRLAAVPEGLASAFYPILSASYARDARKAGHQVVRLLLLATGICASIAAIVAAIASPVARLLFPSDPVLCGRVMLITIWSLPLTAIGGVMGYALNAAGKDAAHARLSFIVAIINLLLTTALVLEWGLIGASWALPLRYIVLIVVFAPCFIQSVVAPSQEESFPAAAPAV